jgi:hypothetical protein
MEYGGIYDTRACMQMVRGRTKIESLAPNEGCCTGQKAPAKEVSRLSGSISADERLYTKKLQYPPLEHGFDASAPPNFCVQKRA